MSKPKKLTIEKANRLLDVKYSNIRAAELKALKLYYKDLGDRINAQEESERLLSPSQLHKQVSNRTQEKNIALHTRIEKKLAILGQPLTGINNTMYDIKLTGTMTAWERVAAPQDQFGKEWKAYRLVCGSHPLSVYKLTFEKKHEGKTPDEKLEALLDEMVGLKMPATKHARSPHAQMAIDAWRKQRDEALEQYLSTSNQ